MLIETQGDKQIIYKSKNSSKKKYFDDENCYTILSKFKIIELNLAVINVKECDSELVEMTMIALDHPDVKLMTVSFWFVKEAEENLKNRQDKQIDDPILKNYRALLEKDPIYQKMLSISEKICYEKHEYVFSFKVMGSFGEIERVMIKEEELIAIE